MRRSLKNFILVGLLWVFVAVHVSSASIIINQGDNVYLNETIDISEAVSWPAFQLAWCQDQEPDCTPPDWTLAVTGNYHSYWMNPAVFTHYGTYYRWDGIKWNPAENPVAFYLLPGKRPVESTNITNSTLNATTPAGKPIYGPFDWVVARGDNPSIAVNVNRTDDCRLWIWGPTDQYYDMPISHVNGTYLINFTLDETMSLPAGRYKAYMVFRGNNNASDVWYNKTDEKFYSLYNSQMYPPITMRGVKDTVRSEFDTYTSSIPYYDDFILPINLVVSEPEITVTDVTQGDGVLYFSGTTSWKENTTLSLVLDPDQHPQKRDLLQFTWTTGAHGPISSFRHWDSALKFDWSDVSVGSHVVDLSTDLAPSVHTTWMFRRSDIMVMPTPTPYAAPILVGMDYSNLNGYVPPENLSDIANDSGTEVGAIVTPNATATATPIPGLTPGAVPNDMTAHLNDSLQTPAIASTTAQQPDMAPLKAPASDGNIHVPVPVAVPLAAMVAAILLWRRK